MEEVVCMTREEHIDSGMEQFEVGTTQVLPEFPKTPGKQPIGKPLPIKKEMPKLIMMSIYKFALGIWLFLVNRDKTFGKLDGISRDGLIIQINQSGYNKRYRSDNTFQYIHEKDNIIKAVEVSQIRDDVNEHVQKSATIDHKIRGIRFIASTGEQMETFLRNSPSLFNDAILGHLPNHTKPILHDTESEMYFPFQNCIVKVTKESIQTMEYSELDNMCIWQDHIKSRCFIYSDDFMNAQFAAFILNVSTNEDNNDTQSDRYDAIRSAIGYLLHNCSDPTSARAVIAYDEQVAGKREPAGGTGKGVLNQAIVELRSTAIIDGKKIRDDNQFSYQLVSERTQVISFDDVKPDFDFLTLNSNLTTGWQIEHKNKPSFRFAPTENPKTYITSNTILKAEGTTASRRQFIIEFSPYYSKLVQKNLEPIIHIHGCNFFTNEWNVDEWNRFYTFMFNCAQYYLINGLQFYKLRAVAENKLMQTTSDDFSEWTKKQTFQLNTEFSISELFTDFKAMYYGEDSEFKQRTFTNWIKTFAQTQGWKLEMKRSNSNNQKIVTGKFIL